ncbi:MAG: precorrin-4 C(11)-methyltransferase [Planctomycetaceae bacterium]|nr:precorrin-4 C(11)-methyltransferase [Planctomycetaceae bacterium]
MIHFVGAGSGAIDLITVRGQRLMQNADVVIYAGSLVNPELLSLTKPGCRCLDSATMTLEEVVAAMLEGEANGQDTVRLHTGDPSLYGAIREQIDELRRHGIAFEVVPGVSSFSAAAAALEAEYTLPSVSQSLIVTRLAGRTPVPESEDLASLAAHGCSMAIFLSAGMVEKVQARLLAGKYTPDTPAAIVYKASWPDQKVFRCTLGELAAVAAVNGIAKTALILIGDFLGNNYERSKLYDPGFSTGFRKGSDADSDCKL